MGVVHWCQEQASCYYGLQHSLESRRRGWELLRKRTLARSVTEDTGRNRAEVERDLGMRCLLFCF